MSSETITYIILFFVVPLIACNSGYECGSLEDNLMVPAHVVVVGLMIYIPCKIWCYLSDLYKSRK